MVAEAYKYDTAGASEDTEETTSLVSEADDVQLTKSVQSVDTTCSDGVDMALRFTMQECLRKLQRYEAAAGDAVKREQELTQMLYEARARIIQKEQEVLNLQEQLAEEIRERQGLLHEVIERERKSINLKEGCTPSKVGMSDAGEKCGGLKTAKESRVSSPAKLTNIATTMPALPKQDLVLDPQPAKKISPRQKLPAPPFSPRVQARSCHPNQLPLTSRSQQCKSPAPDTHREIAVPHWPCAKTLAEHAMKDINELMQSMQSLQIREANPAKHWHAGTVLLSSQCSGSTLQLNGLCL